MMEKGRLPLIALLLLFDCTQAQDRVPAAGIDSLFKAWDRPHTPGFAPGIVANNRLIFEGNYAVPTRAISCP